MLSEALTSIEDVKSKLQQSLLQQPGYRALQVIDRAASELEKMIGTVDVLPLENYRKIRTSRDPEAQRKLPAPGWRADALEIGAGQPDQPAPVSPGPTPSESRAEILSPATDAPVEQANGAETQPPAIFRMTAALRELAAPTTEAQPASDRNIAAPRPAQDALEEPQAARPSRGWFANYIFDAEFVDNAGSPEIAGLDEATSPPYGSAGNGAQDLPRDSAPLPSPKAEAAASAAAPAVSKMSALYLSIGDASDNFQERAADLPTGVGAQEAAGSEAPAAAFISGMAAAFYENVGDASDIVAGEEANAEDMTETPKAAEEPASPPPTAAVVSFKTPQAAPLPVKTPARSYLPYIAAQQLLQNRRL